MPVLFRDGAFRSAAGLMLPWKIECDALTDQDWCWAANRISWKRFGAVEGVPRGGLKLAELLADQAEEGWPLLIVDDVYTTGMSMERQRAGREAIGYVLFARAPITQPWIRALWQYGGPA